MLTTIELDSWLDFEKVAKNRLLRETNTMLGGWVFYRGHSNATWHLETTLERAVGQNLSVRNYYAMIQRIHPKIETFTDQKWEIPSYEDFDRALREHPTRINKPPYIYMTYLRHFGFPSPLLDWSVSPYVAAYFAFRDVASTAKSVAIYSLSRMFVDDQTSIHGEAMIFSTHATPRNNKRHELQQSVYTACFKEINGLIYYASHEDPHLVPDGYGPAIAKYILPASERLIVLKTLQAYNINPYSLFGTEESLLENLFLQNYIRSASTKNIMGLTDINELWG
jgi:hypothetical protein